MEGRGITTTVTLGGPLSNERRATWERSSETDPLVTPCGQLSSRPEVSQNPRI